MKALEATASTDQHSQLKLGKTLQMRNQQVKVIILMPEEDIYKFRMENLMTITNE